MQWSKMQWSKMPAKNDFLPAFPTTAFRAIHTQKK